MVRYIKRYIVCLLSVAIILALFVFFLHAGAGVALADGFFKNALLILKSNLHFLFFTLLFFTVYYFFQTREFRSFKSLFISFLIITLINSAATGIFVYKPQPKDVHVYQTDSPEAVQQLKSYETHRLIAVKDYFIQYKSFDGKKRQFKELRAMNTANGNAFFASYTVLLRTKNIDTLYIPQPVTTPGNARMNPLKIQLNTALPINPVLQKTLGLFHKISAQYVFYHHLKIPMPKKKVYFFINIFLVVFGISAVFMLFGLITSFSGKRIINVSFSFLVLPLAYFIIFYLYKIPIHKLKFLNKGILININTGIFMLVIALILLLVSLFKVKSNSGREA